MNADKEWRDRAKPYREAAKLNYAAAAQCRAEMGGQGRALRHIKQGWYFDRVARRFDWPKPRPFLQDEIRGNF